MTTSYIRIVNGAEIDKSDEESILIILLLPIRRFIMITWDN